MDVIIIPLFQLIDTLLWLYTWVLIGSVVMSWLLAFGVINTHNQLVSTIGDFLFRITEPALNPIRRLVPNFGGLDISPILLIFLIYFTRGVLARLVFRVVGVS